MLFTCIDGYNIIAVNTTLNCSLQEVGTSNRKKRKVAECNNAKEEETDLVPVAKLIVCIRIIIFICYRSIEIILNFCSTLADGNINMLIITILN